MMMSGIKWSFVKLILVQINFICVVSISFVAFEKPYKKYNWFNLGKRYIFYEF